MLIHLNTFFLLLCLPSLTLSYDERPRTGHSRFWRRASQKVAAEGFANPKESGGSFLTQVENTTPPGQSEPVNMIISANSDADVLKDQEDGGGLRNYWLSLLFAGECLGQHSGDSQKVDLGDGHGALNETAVIRYNYNDSQLGTCKESIEGGNHFRYWVQNGPTMNTGAIFMAASYEMPISQQHGIVANGYNLGRDYIVGNITGSVIPTANLTNQSSYSGETSFGGFKYRTTVKYLSGLLQNTSIGINHNDSVPTGDMNAIDGLVALLEVKISERPKNDATALFLNPPRRAWQIPVLFVAFIISLACF
ncbi:hypothetical protein E1B28_012088 [Marasmius oreades]|uniref:Uncharacterized protein n=1 Tax=Marasmius oreades TaxID=181124 RepID=A0A9P7UNK4_9AGAR|nr:uncharacterized protein E1B28_012088 [Marasmius oreades]KAG7088055.1 hypothetical protein E1B28_012088 [Marasmius oreades]